MSATRVSKIRRNATFENHKECAEIVQQIEALSSTLFDKVSAMTPKNYQSFSKTQKIFSTIRELKSALDDDIHKLKDDALPSDLSRDELKFIYYPRSS
jgi:hypothetical protein